MNVALLANHFNTGGITTYLLTLAEGLVKAGDNVWVVSAGGDCEDLLQKVGAKHVRMDVKIKSEAHPNVWISAFKLHAFVKEHHIDIMHAQTRVTSVIAAFVSKFSKVPYITTCHGFFKPKFFRMMFPCWGKTVIAISHPVKEHLECGFNIPASKIALIPNGIDINRFAPVTAQQKDTMRQEKGITGKPVLGIIARLSSVKGIDVLIAAMPTVLGQFPNAILWIVGQGDQESYLKACVHKRNLGQQVKFLPAINQTASILPLFDVFVMPSLQEGLGLSVMEAQACGVVVVASNVGGLVDLIQHGKTGFLVEPNKHLELGRMLVDVLKDQSKWPNIIGSALENIKNNFSAQCMVKATRNCYEQNLRR